jgi:hypothetical protein
MFMEYTNLLLCLGIFIVGYLAYKQKRDKLPLNIGIAFGFFAAVHLVMLFLRVRDFTMTMLIVIKVIAYLVILVTLAKLTSQKA